MAENVKGSTRIAKSILKKGEKPSDSFPILIKKAKKSDHMHFSVDNGSLVIKEKSSSTTILHKISLLKVRDVTIIGGELALAFDYLQEAWVMIADNQIDLTNWAKSIIHLVEQAAKQHESVDFPEFEATESGLTADIDFTTDMISYDYKPLSYKKKAAEIIKAFDLSEIKIEDDQPTSVLKRERSVEVLSDDD